MTVWAGDDGSRSAKLDQADFSPCSAVDECYPIRAEFNTNRAAIGLNPRKRGGQ